MVDADDFDWPSSKQKLFLTKPQRRKEAGVEHANQRPDVRGFFDSLHDDMWDLDYRDGWYFGGENLARDLQQSAELKKLDPDREFHGVHLAMLYCYRHYLEVSLKALAQNLASITSEDMTVDLENEHRLMPLWNEVKNHLLAAFNMSAKDDEVIGVERSINEFHEFDPNSQTFRYRRDKKGNTNEACISDTDLPNLIDTMRSLRNFFNGWNDAVVNARENMPN